MTAQPPDPTTTVPTTSISLEIPASVEHLPKIVFPLSDVVNNLLKVSSVWDERNSREVPELLAKVVQQGQVLWRSPTCADNVVVKCSSEIVVKIVPNIDDYTEYTSLQYVAEHIAGVPLPKPHGLIRVGRLSYIFMSLIEGTTLEVAWPNMAADQKQSVSRQLNEIFLRIRQHQCPQDTPFGGTSGEGCKDTRRRTRISESQIYNCSQFRDFQFSKPSFGGKAYIRFLRRLLSDSGIKSAFSHTEIYEKKMSWFAHRMMAMSW